MDLALHPIRQAADWERLRPDLLALEQADPEASVFHTQGWLSRFWAALLAERQEWSSFMLTGRAAGGELQLACPFAIKRLGRGPVVERTLYFLGSPHRDYGGALWAPGQRTAPGVWTEQLLAMPWDRAVLDALSQEEARHLMAQLDRSDVRCRLRADTPVFGFPLGPEAEAVLTRVTGASSLKSTGAKQRRLEREVGRPGLTACRHPSPALLADFFAMHQRQWGEGRSKFRHAGQRDFVASLFAAEPASAVLDILACKTEPLAMLLGFEFRDAYYYYTPTYDRRYARYSPGQLLIQELIRRLCGQGFRHFHFLRGDMAYKRDYPATLEPRWRVEGWRPTARARIGGLLRRAVTAMRGAA